MGPFLPPASTHLPRLAMSSNLEARLARLEGLIHAQGNTIADQARTIEEQQTTIARLSSDSQAHAATDRHHDRVIHDLAQHIYKDGEWVEYGTVEKRRRSDQSWKLGGDGERKWEWQVRPSLSPPASGRTTLPRQRPSSHQSLTHRSFPLSLLLSVIHEEAWQLL